MKKTICTGETLGCVRDYVDRNLLTPLKLNTCQPCNRSSELSSGLYILLYTNVFSLLFVFDY